MSNSQSGNNSSSLEQAQNSRREPYNTRQRNPKGLDNKNDNFDGYETVTNRRSTRKAGGKPPNNKKQKFGPKQNEIQGTSSGETDMEFDQDTLDLMNSNIEKVPPGLSEEELLEDARKREEMRQAALDALKGKPLK